MVTEGNENKKTLHPAYSTMAINLSYEYVHRSVKGHIYISNIHCDMVMIAYNCKQASTENWLYGEKVHSHKQRRRKLSMP